MTRFVYTTATTLDGYLADDQHSLDWLFAVPSEGAMQGFTRFLRTIGAQVMGSSTYEWVCENEKLREHPERWRDAYGDRATWVFTARDRVGVDGADLHFVGGSVADHVPAIRASADGGDGSPTQDCWTRSDSPSHRSPWVEALPCSPGASSPTD